MVPIIKGEVMYSFVKGFGFFVICFMLLEGDLIKIRFFFDTEYKSSENHISLKQNIYRDFIALGTSGFITLNQMGGTKLNNIEVGYPKGSVGHS
tara:strand:+ start:561 stop:842 length:282 start_codon:yes stop_codon:yes gene_type:complete